MPKPALRLTLTPVMVTVIVFYQKWREDGGKIGWNSADNIFVQANNNGKSLLKTRSTVHVEVVVPRL